jgi:hypothetical protein
MAESEEEVRELAAAVIEECGEDAHHWATLRAAAVKKSQLPSALGVLRSLGTPLGSKPCNSLRHYVGASSYATPDAPIFLIRVFPMGAELAAILPIALALLVLILTSDNARWN